MWSAITAAYSAAQVPPVQGALANIAAPAGSSAAAAAAGKFAEAGKSGLAGQRAD